VVDPEFLAQRWVKQFRRYVDAETGSTRAVADMPEAERAALLRQVPLRRDEVPALLTVTDSTTWLLLTTQRIVYASGGRLLELNHSDLLRVTIFTEELAVVRKHELARLKLVTVAGEDIEVRVPSGPGFYGLWNVLMIVALRAADAR